MMWNNSTVLSLKKRIKVAALAQMAVAVKLIVYEMLLQLAVGVKKKSYPGSDFTNCWAISLVFR